jgi:creatinine amidohydrolase
MLPEANQYRYEYMRLDKLANVIKSCPVAIQPSGLLEWHGNQNAIGLDALKAYYICERTMLMLGGGALMPINWVGTYGFIRYPGTVCYDAETTYNVFIQIYRELIKLGFKVIVILTGHYGQWQMNTLRKARADIEQEAKEAGKEIKFFSWAPPNLVNHLFGGDHAGRYETSMLWRTGQAWGVDLVDVSKFETGVEQVPNYTLQSSEGIPIREPEEWNWNDDLRDKKLCSPEFGEKLIKAIASGIVYEVLDALDELKFDFSPKVSRDDLEKNIFS